MKKNYLKYIFYLFKIIYNWDQWDKIILEFVIFS